MQRLENRTQVSEEEIIADDGCAIWNIVIFVISVNDKMVAKLIIFERAD